VESPRHTTAAALSPGPSFQPAYDTIAATLTKIVKSVNIESTAIKIFPVTNMKPTKMNAAEYARHLMVDSIRSDSAANKHQCSEV